MLLTPFSRSIESTEGFFDFTSCCNYWIPGVASGFQPEGGSHPLAPPLVAAPDGYPQYPPFLYSTHVSEMDTDLTGHIDIDPDPQLCLLMQPRFYTVKGSRRKVHYF